MPPPPDAAATASAEDNTPPSTPVRTNRNDYENPWESAANDRLWERDTTTMTIPMEPSTPTAPSAWWWTNGGRRCSPNRSGTCRNGTLGFQRFQACHILVDIVVGSILVLYMELVLLPQHRWPSICLMVRLVWSFFVASWPKLQGGAGFPRKVQKGGYFL